MFAQHFFRVVFNQVRSGGVLAFALFLLPAANFQHPTV